MLKKILAGRPRTDVVELARLHFWYAAVRGCVGNKLLDVELDRRFLWPGFRPESAERSRVFERLRLSARLLHDERHDKLSRLIDVVEKDPQCRGTKAFYDASFWHQLEERQAGIDVLQASKNVTSALLQYGLRRVDELPAELSTQIGGLSKIEQYRQCLGISIEHVPMLDRAGFLWCLRRLTFHREALEIRDYLDSRIDRIFEQMFESTLSGVTRRMGKLEKVGIAEEDELWQLPLYPLSSPNPADLAPVEFNLALAQWYAHRIFKLVRGEVLINEDIDGWPWVLPEAIHCILPL